jgi:hypothetical protein
MAARQNYERKMLQTFNEDVRRQDFEKKISTDKIWQGSALQDERVMNKRRARVQAEQAGEKEIEMRIKQAGLVERQRAIATREQGLVEELERRKNEKLREEKVPNSRPPRLDPPASSLPTLSPPPPLRSSQRSACASSR